MKFTLILTICSQIYGNCMPPLVNEMHFKTHYECATYGYGLAKRHDGRFRARLCQQ